MTAKRRLVRTTILPALLAGMAGFLISYAFPAKYTSQSLVLIEGQKVPETMVQPVVSEDLSARIATLQQQVLSQTQLQPLVQKLFPGKNLDETSEIIDQIRSNMTVEPVVTSLSTIGPTSGNAEPEHSPVPGFYVKYTDSNSRQAQEICNELTTLLVDQNLKSIQEVATGTRQVLDQGLEEARSDLEGLGVKLAHLKPEAKSAIADLEVQRQLVTIEYAVAQKNYENLLTKKYAATLTVAMNNMSMGERMFPLNAADLPDVPGFPNRVSFAGVGAGAGLLLGLGLSLWSKFRSKVSPTAAEPVSLP